MFDKEKGDTRTFINSLGEGGIWVSDKNGNLESGDYITSSSIPGYGQKQDSEFLANYTVAKITMDCDFNPSQQKVKKIKRHDIKVTYYKSVIPKEDYDEIHNTIVKRVLSTSDEKKWNTIPRTYKEIDDLRAKFEKNKDIKKLKMLDDINVYVEELEKVYSRA